jgi:hypothetical protein
VKVISGSTSVDSLLYEFPNLTSPNGVQREVRNNTVNHIRTTPGPPVTCRPRRLAPDWLAIAKTELDAQLAAPRVLGLPHCTSCAKRTTVGVPAVTTERSTPGLLATAVPSAFRSSFFSKIDLVRTFNRISFHPGDIQKTTLPILSAYSIFLSSFSSQKFQRSMGDSLQGLEFCFAHLDDIPVTRGTSTACSLDRLSAVGFHFLLVYLCSNWKWKSVPIFFYVFGFSFSFFLCWSACFV